MRSRVAMLGLLVLGGATTPAWCGSVSPPPASLTANTGQFVQDRVEDGRRLLFGPHAPHPAQVPPGQTCAELYEQRLRLMQTQYDYKPAYTDDPRNRAAVFIGTIFTPGFYYLAFSGIQSYLDATGGGQTQAEIDALRHASAAQLCFER